MDEQEQRKQEKKRAKDRFKVEKKQRKLDDRSAVPPLPGPPPPAAGAQVSPPVTPATSSNGLTPAERAARAAEANVRLTSARVWIAALTLIISGIAALAGWMHYFGGKSEPVPGNTNAVLPHPAPDAAPPPPESGS